MDGLKDRLAPEPEPPADAPAGRAADVERGAEAAGTPWLRGGLRGRIDETDGR